jgi:membrane associated rhomboid family serine protease
MLSFGSIVIGFASLVGLYGWQGAAGGAVLGLILYAASHRKRRRKR